jgi:hypothetical protein
VHARVIAVRSRSADTPTKTGAPGHAVVARPQREDRSEQRVGHRDPARSSRFRDGLRDPPAGAGLVDVSPRELLEFADAHPGRVEDKNRQPVLRRNEPMDGEDMLGRRRVDLVPQLVRQLDGLVADRVRDDSREVEHHRERDERLADRLARKLSLGQLPGELGDVGGSDLVDTARAEPGEDATEVHPIRGGRAFGDIDARAPPPLCHLRHGRRLRPDLHKPKVGNAHGG